MTTNSYKHLKGSEREFFRLLDLPIPVPEFHDHYLDMWKRHDPLMNAWIRDYNIYLDWCEEQGCTPQQHRVDSKRRFLDWAEEKGGLHDLSLLDEVGREYQQVDRRKLFNGKKLLSIDMIKANFAVLQMVAVHKGGDYHTSWEAMCERFEIHPFLAASKVFRQHCFGEYEPAKTAILQKRIMAKMVEELEIAADLVYLSHDEIVIPYPEMVAPIAARIKKAVNATFGYASPVKFRLTAYQMDPLYDVVLKRLHDPELELQLSEVQEQKNKVVKSQRYEEAAKLRDKEIKLMRNIEEDYARQLQEQRVPANINTSYSLRTEYDVVKGELSAKKKVLFGVPSNKFYMYFRSTLLEEPWQDKDLIFQMDGLKAKWIPKNTE